MRVTQTAGFAAQESADGQSLYYATERAPARTSIWRAPLGAGTAGKVLDHVLSALEFEVKPEGIYYVRPPTATDRRAVVEVFVFGAGVSRQIVSIDAVPLMDFSISPDRRLFIFSSRSQFRSDLVMVENFR